MRVIWIIFARSNFVDQLLFKNLIFFHNYKFENNKIIQLNCINKKVIKICQNIIHQKIILIVFKKRDKNINNNCNVIQKIVQIVTKIIIDVKFN